MAVIELVKYSCKETIEVLRVLLALALRGQLRGLALAYRDENGREETVYTGAYKSNPTLAMGASLRMSMEMERFKQSSFAP